MSLKRLFIGRLGIKHVDLTENTTRSPSVTADIAEDGTSGEHTPSHLIEDVLDSNHPQRRSQALRSSFRLSKRLRKLAVLRRMIGLSSPSPSTLLHAARTIATMRACRRARFTATSGADIVRIPSVVVPALSSTSLPSVTIYDLPNELLQHIFLLSRGGEMSEPTPDCIQYTLTRVCRLWRNVMHETPGMWRELLISWDFDVSHTMRRCSSDQQPMSRDDEKSVTPAVPMGIAEALPLWFDRAQWNPLAIVFKFRSLFPLGNILSIILVPYFSKVSILRLSMPAAFFEELADITRGESDLFPVLSLLAFDMPYADGAHSVTLDSTLRTINLGGSRKLIDLSLQSSSRRFSFIASGLVSGIPYPQLADLIISETALHAAQACEILTQCVNLSTCSMLVKQWDFDDSLPEVQPVPVMLPNLKALGIKFSGLYDNDGQIAPFFDAITTPALQVLKVAAPYAFDNELIPSLVAMQERSCAPLTRLTLADVAFYHEHLPPLFELIPTLNALSVQAPLDGEYRGYPDILSLIAYTFPSDVSSLLLPNLIEVFICDNISDLILDSETGKVLDEYSEQDLSELMNDEDVLDALATRWWTDGEAPLQAAEGHIKRLESATVKWRNVPLELSKKERLSLGRAGTLRMALSFPTELRYQ
ncbi:hypothetical protein Hypma_005145 [Hypsizygus marmoreus]|uniref:F-box domain-containing protein n=1 Tax=Hypsizygus marmoreus TaxID=39966 RepID=A0A369K2S4_HYPMA|nr:hypothetical protein Hypma_005145 [Hypsizygus marmoreus]